MARYIERHIKLTKNRDIIRYPDTTIDDAVTVRNVPVKFLDRYGALYISRFELGNLIVIMICMMLTQPSCVHIACFNLRLIGLMVIFATVMITGLQSMSNTGKKVAVLAAYERHERETDINHINYKIIFQYRYVYHVLGRCLYCSKHVSIKYDKNPDL